MTRKAPAAPPPAAPPRTALAAALVLAAAGLVVSLLLVRLHAQAHAGVASFCAISETINCDKVAVSPYAVVLGLPVAVWGALGYAVALGLSAWGLTGRRLHAGWPAGLLLLFGVAAVGASAALAYVSHVLIGAWCLLCMASWSISLAILVAAVAACRGPGPLVAVRGDLAAVAARPRHAAAALVAGLAALLALSAWYPRTWEKKPVAAPPRNGTAQASTGVRVVEGPLRDPAEGAIVYSDYECPYCLVAHGELKEVLARRPDIKVVKRHFPLDQACNPIIKRPMHQNACEYARAAICAEAQGRFEAMDDALFQQQRGRRPVDDLARALGLDMIRFHACLASPETDARLKADIAAAVKDDVKATPTYVVGTQQFAGKLPVELFAPMKGTAGK